MKSIALILLLICLVSGCQVKTSLRQGFQTAGPLMTCPTDDTLAIFRKTSQPLYAYEFCFNDDITVLVKNNQLLSKAHWLLLKKDFIGAEDLLREGILFTDQPFDFQIKLAQLLVKQKSWQSAKLVIDQAGVEVNEPLRILIEMNLGEFTAGTDLKLLPQTYKNYLQGSSALRAEVFYDNSTYFALSRVDVAKPGVLAGESTMRVSDDGNNIVVGWTDSSVETVDSSPIWRLQSAHSKDGGATWSHHSISPDPQILDMYHFDPMTAYDPINNLMYSGGMTLSFTTPNLETYYVYRWDLDTDIQDGPYVFNGDFFDKGWLAVDDQSNLWMAAGVGGLKSSSDLGETFTDIEPLSGAFSPQPRFKDGCLYIIDWGVMHKCDDNGLIVLPAPNSSQFLFIDSELYPGAFRMPALRLMAFHPDGDIFIIYPDLSEVMSDDVAQWMSRSADDGQTWDTPWIITPDIPGDRILSWIEIDENGGIHVSYMDTRNVVQDDSSPDAYLDMYYSYSTDKGQSWLETRVTPSSLFVPELIWGVPFIGDYNEMSVGNSESVFLSFPWSTQSGDIDMYVAKKQRIDLIFRNGFGE